jgi:hypothetical protein
MIAAIMATSLSWMLPLGPTACGPPPYLACADTRQLMASKDFQATLKAFLGDSEGNYRQHNRPIYKEVYERMRDPYMPSRNLGGGQRLVAGCRFASCPEKTALILDRSGVAAIGVLDYHGKSNPALEVLVSGASPGAGAWAEILKAWAVQAVALDAAEQHAPLALDGVKVRALREEVAGAGTVAKACSKVMELMRRCHL